MRPKELLREYLEQTNIMQLATVAADQPWACNFYRLTPTRLVLFDTKNLTGNPRQEIKLV